MKKLRDKWKSVIEKIKSFNALITCDNIKGGINGTEFRVLVTGEDIPREFGSSIRVNKDGMLLTSEFFLTDKSDQVVNGSYPQRVSTKRLHEIYKLFAKKHKVTITKLGIPQWIFKKKATCHEFIIHFTIEEPVKGKLIFKIDEDTNSST